MKITLGFSPCPNDTFMFDALVNGKINTNGIEFEVKIADVEELNQMALDGLLDVTKLSYFAYSKVFEQYQWFTSGSALGRKNGPLLISKKKIYPDEVNDVKIAIPGGENTTANLLLSIAYPNAKNKKVYLFSDIEEAILSNEVDAGLIIHETRFTYLQKGLKKIIDLGEFWENETGLPIPLGGIVVKRDLKNEMKFQLNKLLNESVKYAFNHYEETYPFVKKYAQELDRVIQQHIDLYVNQFSVDLGEEGRNAVHELFKRAANLNIINKIDIPIFVA